MCTVAFIPSSDGVIFTSLRDENPNRARAHFPTFNKDYDVEFISPVDAQSGGTWAGANKKNTVVILLNGGFENHTKKDAYRKSRGLIVNEILGSDAVESYWNDLNLFEIEPFTLVVFESEGLMEFVWDGTTKHKTVLDSHKPKLWSSSTLYTNTAKRTKENFFLDEISINTIKSAQDLFTIFHSFTDIENGFLINRKSGHTTLSLTMISIPTNKQAQLSYHEIEALQGQQFVLKT